jgi:hypothetical protein
MRFTKAQLRSIKIYNDYEYADGHPYIYYSTGDSGRFYRSKAWYIYYPKHKFKDTPWYDDGKLAFNIFRKEEKEAMFKQAQEKFKEIFNIEELVLTPVNTWMEKSFVEQRNKEIKNLLK